MKGRRIGPAAAREQLPFATAAWRRMMAKMPQDNDRREARKVVAELRQGVARLIKRSRDLAEESLRMKQRADDLDQIIRQRDARKRKTDA